MGWYLALAYILAAMTTTLFLFFFGHQHYTWWNWTFYGLKDMVLGWMWPMYWAFLRR